MTEDKETSREFIQVNLSDDEIQNLGLEMAKMVSEVETLESQKSATTADFTAKIKAKTIEITSASRKIQDGYEMRYEDCDFVDNHITNTRYFMFNGEKVSERKMTQDEIQMGLPGVD